MAAYNRLSVRAPFSSRVAVFRPGTSDYTESGLSQQEESQRLSSNRSFFFRERKIIEMYFSLEVSERNGRLAQSFFIIFSFGIRVFLFFFFFVFSLEKRKWHHFTSVGNFYHRHKMRGWFSPSSGFLTHPLLLPYGRKLEHPSHPGLRIEFLNAKEFCT